MRAFIKKANGKAVRHPEIQWYFSELFRQDGVHLNDRGNDAFLGTFHNSICCFENDPGVCEFPITHYSRNHNVPKNCMTNWKNNASSGLSKSYKGKYERH